MIYACVIISSPNKRLFHWLGIVIHCYHDDDRCWELACNRRTAEFDRLFELHIFKVTYFNQFQAFIYVIVSLFPHLDGNDCRSSNLKRRCHSSLVFLRHHCCTRQARTHRRNSSGQSSKPSPQERRFPLPQFHNSTLAFHSRSSFNSNRSFLPFLLLPHLPPFNPLASGPDAVTSCARHNLVTGNAIAYPLSALFPPYLAFFQPFLSVPHLS
jgi:hypothetical protein